MRGVLDGIRDSLRSRHGSAGVLALVLLSGCSGRRGRSVEPVPMADVGTVDWIRRNV